MHHNHYQVAVLGATVLCESFEHARALQTAADIIVGANVRSYRPQQLDQLASLLTHYGRREAANALVDRTAVMMQGS